MRTLIWLIGIFAIAVSVAMVAGVNDGYVLLVAPPWRVQLSLNLLVVIVVLGFALGYAVIRLVSRTLQLPTRVAQWRDRRRRERAGRALTDSVNALFEGRFSQSLKSASRAYEIGEGASMAALIAARAAHALHDEPRYREWLGQAAKAEQGASGEVARLMTEAELAVEGQRYDEAATRLASLREGGHRHIAMLRLEARVAMALERWEELVATVRQLRKHKALTDEQAAPMLRRAHVERMAELAADGNALVAYWKALPANELQDRGLIERVLPLLAKVGHGELARKQVERLLDEAWNSDLARQYACCAVGEGDVRACLQKAESWLSQQPRDAGLLYALGQLCISAQLWGKAQSYLESSVQQAPNVEAYLALAHLLEKLERSDEAQRHYRAAAEIVAGNQKAAVALLPA